MEVLVERWYDGHRWNAVITHPAIHGTQTVTRKLQDRGKKELLLKVEGVICEIRARLANDYPPIIERYEVDASGWELKDGAATDV